MSKKNKELKKLFKDGSIKFVGKIDPNDPLVQKLLEQTRKEQEKIQELQRIDPEIGNIFVGENSTIKIEIGIQNKHT